MPLVLDPRALENVGSRTGPDTGRAPKRLAEPPSPQSKKETESPAENYVLRPKAVNVLKSKESGKLAADIRHPNGKVERKWVDSVKQSKKNKRKYVTTPEGDVFQLDPSAKSADPLTDKQIRDMKFATWGTEHENLPHMGGLGPVLEVQHKIDDAFFDYATGFMQAPFAAMWGFATATEKHGTGVKGNIKGVERAIKSAWESISNRNSYGDDLRDYWKAATGRTLDESVEDVVKKATGKSQKENLKGGAKILADWGPEVAVLAADMALDLGVGGAATKLAKTGRALKSGVKSGRLEGDAAKKANKLADDFTDPQKTKQALLAAKENDDIKKVSKGLKGELAEEIEGSNTELNKLKAQQIEKAQQKPSPGLEPKARPRPKPTAEAKADEVPAHIELSKGRPKEQLHHEEKLVEDVAQRQANKARKQYGFEPAESLSEIKRKAPAPASRNLDTEHHLAGASIQKDIYSDPSERLEAVRRLAKDTPEDKTPHIVAVEEAKLRTYRDLDNVADVETEAGRAATRDPKLSLGVVGDKPYYQGDTGTITLDSLGLSTTKAMVERGVKKGYWKARLGKDYSVDRAGRQIEDIEPDVINYYRTMFEETETYALGTDEALKEAANNFGYKLRRRGSGYTLRKYRSKERPKKLSNADAVVKELGLGDDALKVARDHRGLVAHNAALEKESVWREWAFPNGIENITPDDAWIAAQRVKKLLDNRAKGKARTTFIDTWLKDPQAVLGKSPSGHRFFNMIRDARDEVERRVGTDFYNVEKIIKNNNLKGDDLEQLRMALDGMPDKVVNPKVHEAAKEIRGILDGIYDKAKQTGIDVAKYREDYFPHRLLTIDELSGKKVREHILDSMEREGLDKWKLGSREEAERAYNEYLYSLKSGTPSPYLNQWLKKVHGESEAKEVWDQIKKGYHTKSKNLVKRRSEKLPVPFYHRNFNRAIWQYLDDANKQITFKKHLSSDNKKALSLIDDIAAEGGSAKVADELLGRLTRPFDFENRSKWGRAAAQFQLITKLNPLTTMVNFSQTYAVGLRTNLKSLLRGIKAYDPEFATKAGAITSQTIGDVISLEGGKYKWGSMYLRAIGFKKSERILRTLAANAGKEYVKDLSNMLRKGKRVQYAERQLRSLGFKTADINRLRREVPSHVDLEIAGKRVSDQTQFRGDFLDMPLEANTPHGKLVYQFKTFAVNQLKLLKKQVIDEAKNGNFRPLAYFTTIYPIYGAGYDKLVDQILLGKEPPESLPDWYWEGLSSIGALGILDTALTSVQFGKKGILEMAVGPTLSDVADGTLMLQDILSGDDDWGKTAIEGAAKRLPGLAPIFRTAIRNEKRRARGSDEFGSFGSFGKF